MTHDVVIIGGGIVGLATALELLRARPTDVRACVLEAEDELAAHQTGRNSGVIHAGLYYRPGSLKARNCAAGRERLYAFCARHGIAHERCGKLVVATREDERPALEELARRGAANGLEGIERLGPEAMREREPHVAGVAGLFVPQTGIVDFADVARAFARLFTEAGGEVRTGARVLSARPEAGATTLVTAAGEIRTRFVINCAGLQADRIARMCGVRPDVRIVPFRGEYWELAPSRRELVRKLIYPVPDPRFPFLGVHFTRMIDGRVEVGPNAVPALRREGYGRFAFDTGDTLASLAWPGFWRMAARHWRMGLGEMWRSIVPSAMLREMRRLVPEVAPGDVRYARSGVRAQAIDTGGGLVDDFRLLETPTALHVLNAPSPAATASPAIGAELAARALARVE